MIEKIREYFKMAYNTGFFYIMLGNALCNFFIFLSNIILVRIVEKGEYGIYSFANNTISYFLLFSGLGMVSGTILLCCESNAEEEKMHALFQYGMRCGLFVNLVMSLIIIVYGCFSESAIRSAERYILLMSFFPVVNVALDFSGIYFRSTLQNMEYARVNVLNAILLFSLSAAGAYWFGAEGIIVAGYFAPAASVFFAISRTNFGKKISRHYARLEAGLKKEIWKISIISMSSNAISQLMHLIDISMIGSYIKDENMVASYRIGMIIPSGLNFIPSSVAAFIFPYFASNKNSIPWKRKKYTILMAGLGMFNLCIAVLLVLAAPLLIRYIFGEQYLDAVAVFRILSINYFLQGTFRVLSINLLSAHKKLKFCLISNIITGALNILGDYLLIPKWGIEGAAATTLLVMTFSGFLLTAYYWNVLKREDVAAKQG